MLDHAELEKIVASIRSRVDGVSAVAVLGEGGIEALVQTNPDFDPDALGEFATLLRIAERVSSDTDSGRLGSMSWTTENAIVLMARISRERCLLLVGSPGLPAGLARYHLSRAARRLGDFRSLSASG